MSPLLCARSKQLDASICRRKEGVCSQRPNLINCYVAIFVVGPAAVNARYQPLGTAIHRRKLPPVSLVAKLDFADPPIEALNAGR